MKINAENERIKRRYFTYLKDAKRQSEASIDIAAKAIRRFEENTKHRSFRSFRVEQAVAFKQALGSCSAVKSGEALSNATQLATLNALRRFFTWLADQPGFRSRIRYSDADYFNYSAKETSVARATRERPAPTPEQIEHVLQAMPTSTDIELRNRALIAFTYLTGIRDRALASLKLKHVDLDQEKVYQDPAEVQTKASKSMTTSFFPVGERSGQIVIEWITYLRKEKLWGDNDPLFPSTRIERLSAGLFGPSGLDRKHWSTASPIRVIFKAAFEQADLPYFNPHSFRRTLARLGLRVTRTPEELKAWSQNLGHEQVTTTLTSYGEVPGERQAAILQRLAAVPSSCAVDSRTLEIAEVLRRALDRL